MLMLNEPPTLILNDVRMLVVKIIAAYFLFL